VYVCCVYCLCVYVSMCLCVYVSMCLCVYVSMCLCVYVSICLYVCVSMCVCLLELKVYAINTFFFHCVFAVCPCYLSVCLTGDDSELTRSVLTNHIIPNARDRGETAQV